MKKVKRQLIIGLALFIAMAGLVTACLHEPSMSCEKNPVKINVVTNDANIGAADGSIIISATGSSKYFTYSMNGTQYQAGDTFSGLDSGTYKVYAMSSFGCVAWEEVHVGKFNPCEGAALSVTVTNAAAGKSDGAINASVTTSGFQFQLNGGASSTTGNFTGLAAGSYSVTATNSKGCTLIKHVTVGQHGVCDGVTIVVSTLKVNPSSGQSDGQILASATGGTGFTYSLNTGAFSTTNTFTGLAAGTYTVTAKSSDGCTGSAQVTLSSSGGTDPCAGVTVTITGTVTDATSGSNGSISVSATGGSGFTYNISNGTYGTATTFSNLAPGSYTIGAKNSNGCVGTKSFTVGSSSPCSGITITISTTTTTSNNCVTTGTGTIVATASGSTGFSYSLGTGAAQSSGTFSALSPGKYTVNVSDANGCTSSTSVTVGTDPAGPLFTSVRTLLQTRCSGSSCHTNGQSQSGYNFDADCNIVSYWSQINSAAVVNGTMPISPQSKLTAAEKLSITNWINAGHAFNQ